MNLRKSIISILLLCVYSLAIAHSMVHIHGTGQDFDAIAVVDKEECSCSCCCCCSPVHAISSKSESNDIKCIAADTHHEHHECFAASIYNLSRNVSEKKLFAVEDLSFNAILIPITLDESLSAAQTKHERPKIGRDVPPLSNPSLLGSNSHRAPPAVRC